MFSAVGSIIVVKLLDPSEYGLVASILMLPQFLRIFSGFGVGPAITKNIAQYKIDSDYIKIKSTLLVGGTFKIVIGLFLTIVSYYFTEFVAINVLKRTGLIFLIKIASINIFASALYDVAQFAFFGFDRMDLYAKMMILKSLTKTIISISIVYLGYGVSSLIYGNTVSLMLSGLIGIILLYFLIYKKINIPLTSKKDIKNILIDMLKYGLPIYFSTQILGILQLVYTFIMVIYINDFLIGNYNAALNFIIILSFFTWPIDVSLFPAFSKYNIESETDNLGLMFRTSVKYSSLVIVCMTVLTMIMAKPIVYILYGQAYQYSPLFLSLSLISTLFVGLGSISLQNILKGQGKTNMILFMNIITMIFGVSMSVFLVPIFKMPGLILVKGLATLPGLFYGLWWLNKKYGFNIDWKNSVKIYFAACSSAILTILLLPQLTFHIFFEITVGSIFFGIMYVIIISFLGGINRSDVANFRKLTKNIALFKVFSYPINIFFIFIEKILGFKEVYMHQ